MRPAISLEETSQAKEVFITMKMVEETYSVQLNGGYFFVRNNFKNKNIVDSVLLEDLDCHSTAE